MSEKMTGGEWRAHIAVTGNEPGLAESCGPEAPVEWIYVGTSRRSYAQRVGSTVKWEEGERVYRIEPVRPDDYPPLHDCPIEMFFDDPITQAYGLGGDWDEWSRVVKCAVCAEER
jgi:hypothetical protein